MKSAIRFRTVVTLAALLALGTNRAFAAAYVPDPRDVSSPSDTVIAAGLDFGSPFNSEVENAINNGLGGDGMKYNNNAGPGSGLEVDPSNDVTIVTRMRIFTADDDPSMDPTSYTLEGAAALGGPYTLISSGPLALPADRNVDNTTDHSQLILFPNLVAYDVYRLLFPTTGNNNIGGGMQIGEVELTPEPSSLVLFGMAALGLLSIRRRK